MFMSKPLQVLVIINSGLNGVVLTLHRETTVSNKTGRNLMLLLLWLEEIDSNNCTVCVHFVAPERECIGLWNQDFVLIRMLEDAYG